MYYKKKKFFNNKYMVMGLIALVIVVILIMIMMIIKSGIIGGSEEQVKKEMKQSSEPVITITKNTEEMNQSQIVLKAVATIEDPEGIKTMTDPSGKEVEGSMIEYVVNDNRKIFFWSIW